MANCIKCGRELAAFSHGRLKDRCAECQAIPAFAGISPPQPATGPTVVVQRRRPPVTTALVGLNVAVFAAMTLAGVSPVQPSIQQLLHWGADWGPLSLNGEPWRLLTSNYVHVGIIHIALNMWCLWSLGNLCERIFEPWTYFLAYTACGVAGSVASLWWHPLSVGAGASGAIFGLAGAAMSVLYLGHLDIPRQAMQRTLKSLAMFAIYNLAFGAVGAGIDNSAHIGGLLMGLALGAAFAKARTWSPEMRSARRRAIFLTAIVVLLAGMWYVKHKNGYVVQYGNSFHSDQP